MDKGKKVKILVTGATGLIGTNLVNKLEEQGHTVLGVARKLGLDLTNREQTARAISLFEPEIVYHLADIFGDPYLFLNVLLPSIKVGVKRFVFTSSIEVRVKQKPDWAKDKLICEAILIAAAKAYGFDYLIVRPHPVYGPHQNMQDPKRNVVANFMRNIHEDKTCLLYAQGKTKRCFTYVDDVTDVLLTPIKNEIVEVGTQEEVSIGELLKKVELIAGKKATTQVLPLKDTDIMAYPVSTEPNCQTSLSDGLQKTWNFYYE